MSTRERQQKDTASVEQIMELAFGFQRSRVFLTAYELDLFTALGGGDKSSEDVAMAVGTDSRATDRLLNALCALGLVEKREGRFSNTSRVSRWLVRGESEYMEGFMHVVHLWDSWSTLTQAVQVGKSVVGTHVNERGNEWLSAFIAAMHDRARRNAPTVVRLLDLSDVSMVLDVGGGSGAYSMAFVRARDGIRATVFDLPNVAPLAKRYIAQEGLSDKVETVVGDYNTDDLGSNFDLVFLSAIIHSNSYDQNQILIHKASQALNPGGQLVIQDFIMEEDRINPAFGALFSLNMLVGTETGDTYTESEVGSWMEEAGLSGIRRKDTGVGTTLIIGRR
ncbi:MAG: methyltransferase [Pseudomonadota bacterium]